MMKRTSLILTFFLCITNLLIAQECFCDVIDVTGKYDYSTVTVKAYTGDKSSAKKAAKCKALREIMFYRHFQEAPKPLLFQGEPIIEEHPEYFKKLFGRRLSRFTKIESEIIEKETNGTFILYKIRINRYRFKKDLVRNGIKSTKIVDVTIQSQQGATKIFVDGQGKGWAPVQLRLYEDAYYVTALGCVVGKHSLSEDRIIVVKAEEDNTFTFNPAPWYCKMNIESIPSGADVYIEGKFHGTTPCSTDSVPFGENDVVLSKVGYSDFKTTVDINSYNNNSLKATLTPLEGIIAGHEYVDLQLPSGTKWATCNIGASSPEEYGNYYAWGESKVKKEYSDHNSWTYNKSVQELAGLEVKERLMIDLGSRLIDLNGKPIYDSATDNWGVAWRMPSDEDFAELRRNCEWTWTTQNGVNGYRVSNYKNGQSIFLPAGGYREYDNLKEAGDNGYYWTSTIHDEIWDRHSYKFHGYYFAYCQFFTSNHYAPKIKERWKGLNVRPVSK